MRADGKSSATIVTDAERYKQTDRHNVRLLSGRQCDNKTTFRADAVPERVWVAGYCAVDGLRHTGCCGR